MERRFGGSEETLLVVQSNIAATLLELGRLEEAVPILKKNYASRVRLFGHNEETLNAALQLSIALYRADNASESMAFSRPLLPLARRVLGADHDICLRFAHSYAYAVLECAAASRDDLIFAEKLLDETVQRMRRVLGIAHPHTVRAGCDLAILREGLAKL